LHKRLCIQGEEPVVLSKIRDTKKIGLVPYKC